MGGQIKGKLAGEWERMKEPGKGENMGVSRRRGRGNGEDGDIGESGVTLASD